MPRVKANTAIDLGSRAGRQLAHVFHEDDSMAIEAALLTGRPLLLKGEPGVGKSQFARAAARALGRGFRQKVVDSLTQSSDLLWEADLIERLAKAQSLGASRETKLSSVSDELDIRRFIRPGPLWWGFDPSSARSHHDEFLLGLGKGDSGPSTPQAETNGMVVLIDEIDKAESDVPNGLLEALGDLQFTPRGYVDAISAKHSPLVIVTTNDERPMPPAFLRRCIVRTLSLGEGETLVSTLVSRGEAHFPHHVAENADAIRAAAEMTVADRKRAQEIGLRPLPGQAEFIDLLNAVFSQERMQEATPMQSINELGPFILIKHAELSE